MLNEIEGLPEGILDARVDGLAELLGGPTLAHLPGRHPQPLFLTVLAHGNESTGFYAVQELLRAYRDRQMPRALSIFFGNVTAAAQGLRMLDGQADYNRVWPGSPDTESPEAAMMRQIVDSMRTSSSRLDSTVQNMTSALDEFAEVVERVRGGAEE